jgi:hypothetical protein
MKSDAVTAGMVGAVIGLLVTGALAWTTWAVYADREFDVTYFMPLYTIAVFVTTALLLSGALTSRLTGAPPRVRTFVLADVSAVAGLAAGSGFGIFGISSSGPPIFLFTWVLLPSALLIGAASAGAWFAANGRE